LATPSSPANITGCAITATTTSAQYLIVYDFKSTVTDGQTLQAYVSAITSANLKIYSDDNDATITIDNAAPAAITDLAAPSSTNTSVTLSWSNPSDGTGSGNASFDVRYTTGSQTQTYMNTNWSTLTQATGEPVPPTTGMTVSGLTCNTTYTFAIKTTDNVGNISTISNVASKATSAVCNTAPQVTDLSAGAAYSRSAILRWTVPADDNTYVNAYDIRFAGAENTPANMTTAWFDTNWSSASLVKQVPGEPTHASNAAGSTRYYTLKCVDSAGACSTAAGERTLYPNTLYYAAMKTRDTDNAESSVSATVANVHTALKYGWNAFSSPFDWASGGTNTLSTVFGDDVSSLYVYRWDGATQAWVNLPTSTELNSADMVNGRGYYIYSYNYTSVQDEKNSLGAAIMTENAAASVCLQLPAVTADRWNLVGNPYTRNLTLDDTANHVRLYASTNCSGTATAFEAAAGSGWVAGAVYYTQSDSTSDKENCVTGAGACPAKMRPWHGVWIKNGATPPASMSILFTKP
jgi:hypothetical protein